MNDAPGTPAARPRGGGLIRNPRDFYSGLFIVAFALFAVWAARNLAGVHGSRLGPGSLPTLFAFLLGACGLGVTAFGFLSEGGRLERAVIEAVLTSSAVVVIYLCTLAVLGHVPAAFRYESAIAAIVAAAAALVMARFSRTPGPVLITASVVAFAGLISTAGLVLTTFGASLLSMIASREFRWIEGIVWSALVSAFCAALFKYGLGLPLTLWPF